MNVFDNIREKLLSYFNTNDEISSDWIKINDGSNPWTIEDFPYRIEGAQFLSEEEKQKMLGVPEDGVDDHCWKCITVNQCWFKNEDFWPGRWRLIEEAKYALEENGIVIAYPQLDVHIQQAK